MQEPRTIHVGMSVQSADGEQLGSVVEAAGDTLRIAKGVFFPKEYCALTTDVQVVAADTITLRQTAEELVRAGRKLQPEEVPAGHVHDVLRAATSTHDLAEEEEALEREAIRKRPSDEAGSGHP